MRVHLLNNYSMSKARHLIQTGNMPAQHLWGGDGLGDHVTEIVISRGVVDVDIRWRWLKKVWYAVLHSVGDPLAELLTMTRLQPGDLVYAADQWSAQGLCWLSRLGWIRAPIFVLVHHIPANRLEWSALRGAAGVGALSPIVAAALDSRLKSKAARAVLLPWGPDLNSSLYLGSVLPARRKWDFVAAGKTNRDYSTLRIAAREGGLSGIIFDASGATVFSKGIPSALGPRGDYPEVISAMRDAACIAVLLDDPERLSGLTEMADAIALGVPLLYTRSAHTPYPLQELGAGVALDRSIEPGQLLHEILLMRDGRRATSGIRELATKYNLERFKRSLLAEFKRLVPVE